MSNLHDTDFYSWTQQQAGLLRTNNIAALDIANLIEEIEDMGRSEKRELKSRLQVLIMHLLKWQYQPRLRGTSWEATIKIQRLDAQEVLQENPGLKTLLPQQFHEAYRKARLHAVQETHLPLNTFPLQCPWSIDQVMSDDFWPE